MFFFVVFIAWKNHVFNVMQEKEKETGVNKKESSRRKEEFMNKDGIDDILYKREK